MALFDRPTFDSLNSLPLYHYSSICLVSGVECRYSRQIFYDCWGLSTTTTVDRADRIINSVGRTEYRQASRSVCSRGHLKLCAVEIEFSIFITKSIMVKGLNFFNFS